MCCIKFIDGPNVFIGPSAPCSLEVDTVTSTSVTLQWMPPDFPNGVITKYSIEYNGKFIDEFGGKVSDKMMGTIEGLSSDTAYVLELKAYTRIGAGPSASVTEKTRKLLKCEDQQKLIN